MLLCLYDLTGKKGKPGVVLKIAGPFYFCLVYIIYISVITYNLFYYVVCRVKTNPKNAINEHFLPRFLDFVVWGHEHECLIDPQVQHKPNILQKFLI